MYQMREESERRHVSETKALAALDLDEQLHLPTLFFADFLIHSTVFISFHATEINKQDVNSAQLGIHGLNISCIYVSW